MPRNKKDPKRKDRGPGLDEDVCIGEEVKIGINLALERFRYDSSNEVLVFPSSLSTVERAYIHRMCDQLGGLKSRSRGTGQNRYITVSKETCKKTSSTFDSFALTPSDLNHIGNLLHRFPVTEREREDLMPVLKKQKNSYEMNREKINFGRLTTSTPLVPPKRLHSDLNSFRESLPVFKMGQTIVETINANKVCLIAGETGSGKTTQVPQLILDDCHKRRQPCRILCTQPRRIAAISIAERVASERGERPGVTVGYQIRLESKVSPKTVVTFCTAGVVLRSLVGSESSMGTVTHIIVDEVHERDKFVDFLLLCLKQALPNHPNLHVILMSATLNMELFSQYFNNCPVVCVPGNLHSVDEYFLEDVLKWTDYKTSDMNKVLEENKRSKDVEEHLQDWLSHKVAVPNCTADSDVEDDSDVTTSDNAEELGDEIEDLEPAVKKEMDSVLQDIWLTGNKDLFHKVLHLVSSESISVDYAQSESSATALMIAAGRGFVDIVEHLLDLGANINARTINDWSALDFARQFKHKDVIDVLEAFASSSACSLVSGQDETVELISEEDRVLLTAYQHSFDDEKVDIKLIQNLIYKIHTTSEEGAILVFLPGYDDIITLHMQISEDEKFVNKRNGFVIYTLHSSIQAVDQKKVFKASPRGVRKIILSTNIAETSVTINDVVYVIDSGKVKEKAFDALSNFTTLKSNWISKASALQRKGRAGRCQPGKCYHLFSRARYIHLQDYPTPEILRLPLQELCLQTKLLAPNADSISEFVNKCPQAPPMLVINSAVQVLKQIDVLDPFEDLTELGQHLSDLPIEPRLGKRVLYSVVLKCLDPVLTIVCTLSHREPFILPSQPSQRRGVMTTRRKFAEQTYSDHFVLLRAFQLWQKARAEGWELAFCEKNSISSANMQMLVGMRMQLLSQLKASGFLRSQGAGSMRDLNTNSDNWALVKACLVAGTSPNIIQRTGSVTLSTKTEKNLQFHTSSVICPPMSANQSKSRKAQKKTIKDLPSRWLMYEEMSRIGRICKVRCCTLVSGMTMFLFAGPSKVPPTALGQKRDSLDKAAASPLSDPSSQLNVFKPDDWLTFHFTQSDDTAAMGLRLKLHSLFLNRMRHPQRSWTQADETILKVITTVLSNAEAAIGLANPIGVGQKPRSNVLESVMGAGFEDYYSNHQQHQQHHHHQQQPRWVPQHGHQNSSSYESSQYGSTSNAVKWKGDKTNGQNSDGCFFIMKAASHKLLETCQSKRYWATSTGHEGKLSKAYMSGKTVYLIFSVQGSGHFQGYAKMTSGVTRTKSPDFPSPGLSAVFSVEWLKSAHLPFQLSHHLLNMWNENKKVQESRDGQELEPGVAVELLKLWDKFQHQLKPFKMGHSHRQKSEDQQQQRGQRSEIQHQHHRPSQQHRQTQSHRKSEKLDGASCKQEDDPSSKDVKAEGGRKKELSKDSSSSSPTPSTISNEGSHSSGSSPAHHHHHTHQLRQPTNEPIQPENSSLGLLGESPGGLMSYPLQMSGQQGSNPTNTSFSVMYGNIQQQQQQQALALAQQSFLSGGYNPYVLAQGGMVGQSYVMGTQPGLTPVMMLQRGMQSQQQQQQHHNNQSHQPQ